MNRSKSIAITLAVSASSISDAGAAVSTRENVSQTLAERITNIQEFIKSAPNNTIAVSGTTDSGENVVAYWHDFYPWGNWNDWRDWRDWNKAPRWSNMWSNYIEW